MSCSIDGCLRSTLGKASGGTGKTYSPRTCSASRLVTSSFSWGQSRSSSTTWDAAAVTCSKLSRSSNICLARSCPLSSSSSGRSLVSLQAERLGNGGQDGLLDPGWGPGQQSKPHPSKRSISSAAAWSAMRVLPMPPGPVRVSKRTSSELRRVG